MNQHPFLAFLVGGLGGAWLLIVTVQFLQSGHWTSAVLTGAAAVALFWVAVEEFLKHRRH